MDYSNFRIKACVDWIGIGIQTASTTKAHTVSKLAAEALGLPKGNWPSVTALDEGAGGAATKFEIRLQEPRKWQDVKIVCDRLRRWFPKELVGEPTASAIEISVDAYSKSAGCQELIELTAHMYSGLARFVSNNRRLARKKYESVSGLVGMDRKKFLGRLEKGWMIAIGNRFDNQSQRIYFKTTDKGGLPLPKDQHRARVELTLRGQALPLDSDAFRFEEYAEFFSWTIYGDTPSNNQEALIRNWKAQYGERKPQPRMLRVGDRMVRSGGMRAKPSGMRADSVLNKRARQALHDLSKQWVK